MSSAHTAAPYLSPAEIARQLNISVRTVHRAINAHELSAIRVRGQWRVLPENYEAWIKAGQD